MAKNFNSDDFNGSIGDKTYYTLKGVGKIVRKKYGPSKQEMQTNPNFAKTLRNNKEFGGASIAAKAVRTGLEHLSREFQDNTMSGRLTSVIRNIIASDKSNPNVRPCNITTNQLLIKRFQLSKAINFDNIYSGRPIATINDQQSIVTVTIGTTNANNHIKPPKNATHFKITAAMSLVANHEYNPTLNLYTPSNPQQNGIGTVIDSEYFAINQRYDNITLTLNTPYQQPLAPDVTATIWLGIIYYKLELNEFVSLHSQKAMNCIATF